MEARQPLLLLFFRAELPNGEHDQRALDGNETTQSGISTLDFLHDQPVFNIAHSGATVTFEVCAEETQPPHFGNQFHRKCGVAISLADHGEYFGVDEIARGLPYKFLLLVELGIDQEVVGKALAGHDRGFRT